MKLIERTPVVGPSSIDEDQVGAVLRRHLVLRRHRRGEAAGAAIDFENALDVLLDAREREGLARLSLGLFLETLGRDGVVALEDDAVDDRVLEHAHDEVVAARLHLDVGEQSRLRRARAPTGRSAPHRTHRQACTSR